MAALTPAQRRVLGLIACGEDGGHRPKVLATLEDKCLIVGHEVTLPGRFPVTVVRWEVPIGIHIQWCEWCAQQPDEYDQP